MPDLNDFVAGLRDRCSSRDGVVTIEFPHLLRLIEDNQFDTIYHEHFSYFSLSDRAADASRPTASTSSTSRSCHARRLAAHLRAATPTTAAAGEPSACTSSRAPRARAGFDSARRPTSPSTTQVQETKRKPARVPDQAKRAGQAHRRLRRARQGQHAAQLLRHPHRLLDYTVDRNPVQAGQVPARHAHPDPPPGALARDAARLRPHPAVEPEGRDRGQQMAYIRDWGGQFVVPIPDVRGALSGRPRHRRARRGDARADPASSTRSAAASPATGVRAHAGAIGPRHPADAARGAIGHARVRLDRAARVEHPRGLGQGPDGGGSSTSARSTCTWSATARRCGPRMPLEELRPHLHSLPDQPDLIPYRTSYYKEDWGFCLSAPSSSRRCRHGDYEVRIDTTLEPGRLTYGECLLPGETRRGGADLAPMSAIPSLANDNLSGIVVATFLGPASRAAATAALHVPLRVRARHHRRDHLAGPRTRTRARSRPPRPGAHLPRRPAAASPTSAAGAATRRSTAPSRTCLARRRHAARVLDFIALRLRRAAVLLAGLRPAGRLPHAHAAMASSPSTTPRPTTSTSCARPAGGLARTLLRRHRRARAQPPLPQPQARSASRSSASAACTGPDRRRSHAATTRWRCCGCSTCPTATQPPRHRRALRARLPGYQAGGRAAGAGRAAWAGMEPRHVGSRSEMRRPATSREPDRCACPARTDISRARAADVISALVPNHKRIDAIAHSVAQ